MTQISRRADGSLILEWGGNSYELSDDLMDAFHHGRASILIEVLEKFIRQSVRCAACDGTGSLTLAHMTSNLMPVEPLETDCIDCTICDGRGRVPDA